MTVREITRESALTLISAVPCSAVAAGACYLGARLAILSINPHRAAIMGAKIAFAHMVQSVAVHIISKVPSVSHEIHQIPAPLKPILLVGMRTGQLALASSFCLWGSPAKLVIDMATIVAGSILCTQVSMIVLRKGKNLVMDYYLAMVQSEETLKLLAEAKSCKEGLQPGKKKINEKWASLSKHGKELGLDFSRDRKENDAKIEVKKTELAIAIAEADAKNDQAVKVEKQGMLGKMDSLQDALVLLRAEQQKFKQDKLEEKNLWLNREKALRAEIQNLADECEFALGKADIERSMQQKWKQLRAQKTAAIGNEAELKAAKDRMVAFERLWNKVIQLRAVLELLSQMEA